LDSRSRTNPHLPIAPEIAPCGILRARFSAGGAVRHNFGDDNGKTVSGYVSRSPFTV
jgi:hypothetical protein